MSEPETHVLSSAVANLQSFWFFLTRPSSSITDPELRHRVRALASTFLLTIVLSFGHMLQHLSNGSVPPYLFLSLGTSAIAYIACRTRWYRVGSVFAIIVLAFVA